MGTLRDAILSSVMEAAGSVEDEDEDNFSFTGFSDDILKAVLTPLLSMDSETYAEVYIDGSGINLERLVKLILEK